jgi:23S rRNA pseudouridine955/2504/2580 synthase
LTGSAGSRVETREVTGDEADIRLDRWFKRHFPGLGHGRLEKLLRTGQVRVDGGRVKAKERLRPGQLIRIPPLGGEKSSGRPSRSPVSAADSKELRARVLYRDDDIIAIDKQSGLAVQGGSKTVRHLDAMLDALGDKGDERPRLVHRLDRDTSGVLVLARSVSAAAWLGRLFRGREVIKTYWAVVVGEPERDQGRIDLALSKRPGPRGERMVGDALGLDAVTDFKLIDRVGRQAAWLALRPSTGRTHQLRVHCAAMGTPIMGDGKYGGADAYLGGGGFSKKLHLHARSLSLPKRGGGMLHLTAPLPAHMAETWRLLGFDAKYDEDPFAEAPS